MTEKLSPIDLGTVLVPDVELGIGLPDIAIATEGIPVTAWASREDLLLHATVTNPETGTVLAESPLPPMGDGHYAGTLPAPAGIWRITVCAVAEVPPVCAADLVWVVEPN